MMFKKKTILSCATGLIIACSTNTNAQVRVIDFESLKHEDSENKRHGSSYHEDGFLLVDQEGKEVLNTFGTQERRFTGSTSMFNNTINGVTRLSSEHDEPFDLISINLAELNGDDNSPISFTGTLYDGGTVQQTFRLDGNAFDHETFYFDGFDRVSFVTWTQVTPYHQFDDIVVNLIPEPASIGLISLGLCALTRRRRTA